MQTKQRVKNISNSVAESKKEIDARVIHDFSLPLFVLFLIVLKNIYCKLIYFNVKN